MTLLDEVSGRIAYEPNSGCWIWMGFINPGGYAMFRKRRLHRSLYEESFGPVPRDLVVDHKCRVRCCINPDHLEAVTNGENVLRGTSFAAVNARKVYCKHGHELTAENVLLRIRKGRPRRHCRICHRRMTNANKARWKAARALSTPTAKREE